MEMETEEELAGPSPRQSARTKGEVKYYDESEKMNSPKKQRGKKVLLKPGALKEEDEKAAEFPKGVAKRGKQAEPSAAEEKKGRSGKKEVASSKSTGLFYQ